MAYDFQRDFIEPLTKDLTEGNLGGAEDFANAVTKYYMNTVQKGLPQGVPITLPAPGLNPTAPPPFVIGAKGVVPNEAKRKIFYETVKAYFLAKELSLDKGSIKGLKDSVIQTTNKLKAKKQEITDLIKQTKELTKEVANIPIYILEVVEGAKEVIQEEKDKIKEIGNLFSNLKEELKEQGIDESRFKEIFSQELSLVDQVTNFKLTSFQDFTTIPDKINAIRGTVDSIKSSAGVVSPEINSPADLERARAAKQNYSAFDQAPQSTKLPTNTTANLTTGVRSITPSEILQGDTRIASILQSIIDKAASVETYIETDGEGNQKYIIRSYSADGKLSVRSEAIPVPETDIPERPVGSFTGDALTDQIRRAESFQQDKINALKFYAANRISEAATSIEQLSVIIIEPPRFINYIERVARKNPKADRLYRAITKLDAVERLIKPQIKKLEIQIDIKKKEIKNYIEPRIDALKKKLEDRVTEYVQKKKAGAKLRLYSKAQQRVKDFRKQHEEQMKIRKEEVQMTLKAIRKANSLFNKAKQLQQSVVLEFENIKSELILLKEKAVSGELLANYAEMGKDLKTGLANMKLEQLANSGSLASITPTNPTQQPTLRTQNPNSFVQGYDRQINSVADLERTRELRRNSINNQQSDVATPEQVYTYMNQLGLGDFATPVVGLLAEAKTDIDSFKRLFERRVDYYKTFMATIQDLVAETKDLLSLLQEISESKGPIGKKVAWAKSGVAGIADKASNVGEKIKYSKLGRYAVKVKVSMQDLLNELIKKVDPLIKKAIVWASRLYKKAKTYIEEKVQKFQKDIETYLINLIPLKGYQKKKLEDAENRKMIIEAKKQRIEEFKKTIQYYQKLGQFIGKAARGSQGLFGNIFQKKVFAFPQNRPHIKNIADGIYGYLMLEAGDDQAKIAGLKQEKDEFESQMKTIGVVDALINGLIILFKEITKTPAGQVFLTEVKGFTQALTNSGSQYATLWSQFVKVFDSPPTTVEAIKAFVDDTLSSDGIIKMLESTEVVTFLYKTEKKYLGGVRELLKSLTDASVKEAATQIETAIQNQRDTFSTKYVTKKGFEVLTEWNQVLSKKESFIKFMLTELKKALDKFIQFVQSKVEIFIEKQKAKLQQKFEKKKATYELELEKIKERAVNVDAKVMSIAMGLAARLFWTGATWQGNTGTNHLTLTIGPFKPMNALPEDGVTGLVNELGKSFENQVAAMSGLIIPPANTGIVPIPFQGYK